MIGSHNSNYAIPFYNDRVKEVVDSVEVLEPFTYVPIKAGHMELVGGNAVVFGKITEGQNVINIGVSSDISYVDVALDNPLVPLLVRFELVTIQYVYYNMGEDGFPDPTPVDKSIWDGTQSWRILYGAIMVVFPLTILEGSSYAITIINTVEGINVTVSYTAVGGDTYANVKAALIAELITAGQGAEILYGLWRADAIFFYPRNKAFMVAPNYHTGTIVDVYKDFDIDASILTLGYTIKYPQLKCGAIHEFGFVYKDLAGRQCSVIKSKETSIYMPFFSEDADNQLNTIAVLTFFITHVPPDWAETYEIVYFGNISMDWFLQIREEDIKSIGTNRYAMNIQDTISIARGYNTRWKVADYVWQEGDRLRLVGTIDEATVAYGGVAIGSDLIYDYEIEQVGTEYGEAVGGDWLIFQAIEKPATFENANTLIVEIYRPRKGLANTTPYGTGMVFGIGVDSYGNRYHKGDVDQIFDSVGECINSGEVINRANDSYKFMRLNYKHGSATILPFWCESVWPSDWWTWAVTNKLTSQGFPFLDDLSQRQTVLDERLRHGGFIITGTKTNNLAHFTYEDFLDLAKKNGDITGLREVGYVLKVLQLYKETSIYIQRIQTFNASGDPTLTVTDKFLGTVYPLETEYGCQHPDSLMVNGRYLYYWDNSQGAFIRSAPNGQVVLDVKMKRWFKDLIQRVRLAGGADILEVRTGANNDHEEVWISFRFGDETTGLIFNEGDGRFKSRINLTTESYIHLGAFFAHLYRQRIWIMNVDEGQSYLSWVGVETYAELEVVSNIDPTKNKIFQAIALLSDHLWQSNSKTIVIPEEASAVNEIMETNVAVWNRREGVYYGSILKDENSKGNFASVIAKKMNGRVMRGRYCYILLKTEEHAEKVRLDSIIVMSTDSERNA